MAGPAPMPLGAPPLASMPLELTGSVVHAPGGSRLSSAPPIVLLKNEGSCGMRSASSPAVPCGSTPPLEAMPGKLSEPGEGETEDQEADKRSS